MYEILLVIQVIIALALIAFVLLQRSDSDGFGLGSSSGGGVMSGKGKATFMTRTTAILAAAFMLNSLFLAIITTRGSNDSIASTLAEKQAEKKELTAPLGEDGVVIDTTPVKVAPAEAAPVETPEADVTPKVEDVTVDDVVVPTAE